MAMVLANGLNHHVQRLSATRRTGAGPAPTMVLVHGILPDSLASYYFTVGPAFAAAGLDVIMYDLRGHGRSARPSTGYRLADFLDDLDALLDVLVARVPVHLVGNSFGGTVAFGYAERRPERVASVVLVESTPATPAWARTMATVLARAKDQLPRPEVIAGITDDHRTSAARLVKHAAGVLWSTSIAEDLPASEVLPTPQIAAMVVPTMAIYGGESKLVEQASWLKWVLPSCTPIVIPDQGHFVLMTEAARSAELILGWLQDFASLNVSSTG